MKHGSQQTSGVDGHVDGRVGGRVGGVMNLMIRGGSMTSYHVVHAYYTAQRGQKTVSACLLVKIVEIFFKI